MKVALAHDWLNAMRGGEKVLEALCEGFPDADLYVLLHKKGSVSATIAGRRIETSFLQRLPGVDRYYRYLLPLMPFAAESLRLAGYDLVISSSHCAAKGGALLPGPDGRRPLHVCYCHTPMRYIYEQFDQYFGEGKSHYGWFVRAAAGVARNWLAGWDAGSSRQVDRFIANSEAVKGRILLHYGRDSVVIHPPVDTDFYTPAAQRVEGGYYLVVSALVPYKRVDLAIQACRQLKLPLKIVGRGTEEGRLARMARGADVEFLGWLGPEKVRGFYRDCAALLHPQEEDFGIAAVEAMACGKPVVAYRKGGALETVVEGVTGVFFDLQTPDSLAEAIERSRKERFDPAAIRSHALRFDKKRFTESIARFVDEARASHACERKTRVMQVIECGGPGGTGNQVAGICNGLDQERFETVLVYSVRPGTEPQGYRAEAAGARTAHLVPEMVREISPLDDLRALWSLIRIIRSESPDVVHAHSSKAGGLVRLAALLCRIPRVLYSPHGYAFLQRDRAALSRLFYRCIEWGLSGIGEVVAVSPSEARLAKDLSWGGRVHTVCDPYLGPQEPPPLAPHPGLVVGACGRLTAARAPKAFVRLAAGLCRRRADVRCVWIGSGELEADVLRLADELGISGRFEVTGWLRPRDVLERMRSLDVFVHYSLWEGLPNAVLEAMAMGLPVVASDIPGNRDAVSGGVTGSLARDEDGLLEAVLAFLEDEGARRRCGQAGRERILREFLPKTALSALEALYRPV